jgi:hypothetical protein
VRFFDGQGVEDPYFVWDSVTWQVAREGRADWGHRYALVNHGPGNLPEVLEARGQKVKWAKKGLPALGARLEAREEAAKRPGNSLCTVLYLLRRTVPALGKDRLTLRIYPNRQIKPGSQQLEGPQAGTPIAVQQGEIAFRDLPDQLSVTWKGKALFCSAGFDAGGTTDTESRRTGEVLAREPARVLDTAGRLCKMDGAVGLDRLQARSNPVMPSNQSAEKECSVKSLLGAALVLLLATSSLAADTPQAEEGFVSLFDGKTLDGWKVGENAGHGQRLVHPRGHLPGRVGDGQARWQDHVRVQDSSCGCRAQAFDRDDLVVTGHLRPSGAPADAGPCQQGVLQEHPREGLARLSRPAAGHSCRRRSRAPAPADRATPRGGMIGDAPHNAMTVPNLRVT